MQTHRPNPAFVSARNIGARDYSSGARSDARHTVRYGLEVDVLYTWTERGAECKSRGRTRDMSPKGAYVIAPVCPPHGATITMSFFMPMMQGESQPPQVQAESHVLRVHRNGTGGPAGFSVEHVRTMLCAS